MELSEIRVGPFKRSALKAKCRRIYNRLVVEDAEFQASADELQNAALMIGFLVVVLGSIYVLFNIAAPGALRALVDFGGLPESARGWASSIHKASPVASLALTILIFFISYRRLSRWAFELSATWFIGAAKMTLNRKKMLRMLDIVENWMQTQPAKVCDAHNFLFKKSAGDLLPANLAAALQDLREPGAADALIVRGFAEKRYWPVYLASLYKPFAPDPLRKNRSYWREARGLRNAIRVNLAFDVLGAELRDEIQGGERWRRDYRTDFPRQHTSLIDTEDLQLRLKSGAPYYRWPTPGQHSSEKETALFRMIMCLENPMQAPLDIISVDEILARFEPAVAALYPELKGDAPEREAERHARVSNALEILQKSDIYMYGKRSRQSLRPSADAGLDAQPVLRNVNAGRTDENGDALAPFWQLRWDPNVIDWSSTVDPDGALFRALAILVQAVDMAGDNATRIRLGRGDALVFDNLRCLICRREWIEDNITGDVSFIPAFLAWGKKIIFVPDRWWLRGYYGFRKSRPLRQAHGS